MILGEKTWPPYDGIAFHVVWRLHVARLVREMWVTKKFIILVGEPEADSQWVRILAMEGYKPLTLVVGLNNENPVGRRGRQLSRTPLLVGRVAWIFQMVGRLRSASWSGFEKMTDRFGTNGTVSMLMCQCRRRMEYIYMLTHDFWRAPDYTYADMVLGYPYTNYIKNDIPFAIRINCIFISLLSPSTIMPKSKENSYSKPKWC